MGYRYLFIIALLLLVLSGIALAVLSHPAFGLWRHVSTERIQASPNYRDGMFRNQLPTPQFTGDTASARSTLWRFLTHRDTLRVPQTPLPAVKTDLKSLPSDSDWLVWFGHSSYLFCLNGRRFLVDPVLQPEWPSSMMMRPFPGTDIYRPSDLPDIDVLILTHEHWDHMDYATLRDLRDRVRHVICPLGIADYLRYWGYPDALITEMDWYESLSVKRSVSETVCQSEGRSVLYLGDSLVDRDTARNAGLPFVACSWGFVPRERLVAEGIEHIIDQPVDLLNYVH